MTYIFFIPIFISTVIYIFYFSNLLEGGHTMSNIDFNKISTNSIFNLCYNYQKFFNMFITPLNIHLLFTNFRIPQSTCLGFTLREFIISFSLFLIFLYSFFKNYKFNNFYIFVITIILTTFVARAIISDYDVRYNIYTNFFIIYFYFLIIEKILLKKLIIRFILVTLIIISCVYNLKNFLNLEIQDFKDKNTVFKKNVDSLSSLNKLKKIKFDYKLSNNKDYDLIISSINTRLVYQVFNKQSCYLKEIVKCTLDKDKKILLIISKKEKDLLNSVNYNNSNIIEYIHKY